MTNIPFTQRPWLDRFFGLTEQGTTVQRELRAGLTTFLTMSYILFVNPQILSAAIDVPNAFVQLLMVTALSAAFGSAVMGLVARYPFAQAPGMGLNAFFTYTVVLGMGLPWQTALGAVFISGVLFVLLSMMGARQAIVQAIPLSLKLAITGGIGAFLAFIGLKNAGIVVANDATLVGLGHLTAAPVWLALFGLVISGALMARRVTAAVLWGILATTILAIVTGAQVYAGGADGALQSFPGFTGSVAGIFGAPVWPSDLVGQLDIAGALSLGALSVIFTFFFVDFFDATGTLTGLAQRAGYMREDQDMPRARRLFASDGLAAMFGAFMGTSTTTAFVESASGIEEGGRTGLTAVTVAVLFLLATFLWPLAAAIPGAATAPALILVGAMMLEGLKHIDWEDITEALPAFLTLLFMPLTFSIANGVSFGVISYCGLKLLSGRGREVSPILYFIAALLAVRYVYLGE
ncbi:Xanthine/uracil/vitamin C permease (plasmid) [Deinococcus proteolyticus MRP]|uniref:Xanthine/uracil/vitamin C permease n=1 Tax=Deinococcus proteolyticus (strain ATCC 35074 / DSM 20540 / JCM 6276 / NBRC 101906 / NCIMB 13154 / VKM Ac-1939 / CCM 2703 / MRP) TaxID=693977 RepID=F0RPS9_DEIPM|nr:NCS2 family permease [Deinococcus proteolyticus]ADY27385.1 Xanthine/uracil/vitamin C permease [Deinococcus proteolyticus MRP]